MELFVYLSKPESIIPLMIKTAQNPGVGYTNRLILSNFYRVQAGQVSKEQARQIISQACGLSKEQLIEHLCRNYNGQVVQACEYLDLI